MNSNFSDGSIAGICMLLFLGSPYLHSFFIKSFLLLLYYSCPNFSSFFSSAHPTPHSHSQFPHCCLFSEVSLNHRKVLPCCGQCIFMEADHCYPMSHGSCYWHLKPCEGSARELSGEARHACKEQRLLADYLLDLRDLSELALTMYCTGNCFLFTQSIHIQEKIPTPHNEMLLPSFSQVHPFYISAGNKLQDGIGRTRERVQSSRRDHASIPAPGKNSKPWFWGEPKIKDITIFVVR